MTRSSIRCSPGDVVLVSFPFTDQSQRKLRPAVVVSADDYRRLHDDVVLVALTTQLQSADESALTRWKDAGLPKPTWVKPVILSLASSLITRNLGSLCSEDVAIVRAALNRMIATNFHP